MESAERDPTPMWLTPSGVVAILALISATVSIGWSYRSLTAAQDSVIELQRELGELNKKSVAQEFVQELRKDVNILKEKQERVVALEVKLDNIQRTVDEIKGTIIDQAKERGAGGRR